MEINGKKVTLRAYIPAKEGWDLLRLMPQLTKLADGKAPDYDEIVTMLRAIIEDWEFDGDPSDPASYENLDLFRELLPLFTGVADALGDMMASRKN